MTSSRDELRFGVLANIADPGSAEEVRGVCRTADRLGFDRLAFGDHLSWPTPEAWTVLAWAAGFTDRIRLTHLVLNNTYRHPVLLAQMGASLDFLSGGRFELGIGAGSTGEAEYRPFGFVNAPFRERIERLRESLTIIRELWEDGQCEFSGDHFQVQNASVQPMPEQAPRPPILVGGQSDAVADIAAEYDGWNFGFDLSPETCRSRLEDVQERSADVDGESNPLRTPVGMLLVIADTGSKVDEKVTEIAAERDVTASEFRERHEHSFIGTPEGIRRKVEAFREAGINEFYLWGPSVSNRNALETFASEVMR